MGSISHKNKKVLKSTEYPFTTVARKKETILVFSAHSDDFVLGAGGTIAHYTQEGKKVLVFVFSYGEKSHPWLQEKFTKKMRAQEAFQASKVLGCKTTFFDLEEFKFYQDYQRMEVEKQLLKIITKEKPTKIFTHSKEDPHPDHNAVNRITEELCRKIPASQKPEVYIYSVWNPISFRTNFPSLYVDVSKTFGLKLKALRTFRSQQVHVIYPFVLVLYKAIKDGIKIGAHFGEHFFRII